MNFLNIEHHRVDKGWGYELCIVNKPLYCGKILHFYANKKFSWHYHNIKDETFYCLSGCCGVYYSNKDDLSMAEYRTLTPGMSFYVPRYLRHQIFAREESEIIEFSTEHFDEDSIRISNGD